MKMRAQLAAVGLVLLGCGGDWFKPDPTLVLEPAAPVLYACQGEAASEPTYLGMRKLGEGGFSWTVQPGARVSASPLTGTSGGNRDWTVLTADASGLAAGTHADSITVVSPECDNSPVTVPVEIAVAASGEAFMKVEPLELSFAVSYLGAAPAPESIQISNLGGGSFDWAAEEITSWVGPFNPSSDSCAAETDTVDVSLTSPPSAAMGIYTGWLRVTATGGNPEQRVKVTLSVDVSLGLVAHWRFDEAGGATVFDSSGSGYDGTLNGPTRTPGRIGTGALEFDGTGDYVQVGAANLPVPWTVAAWVNRVNSPLLLAELLYGAPYMIRLEQYENSNRVGITYWGVADPKFNYTVPVGTWTHLVLVAAAPTTALYANGTPVDTVSYTIPCPMGRIGHSMESMLGGLDDMRIYDRALTPEEIQALASMGE